MRVMHGRGSAKDSRTYGDGWGETVHHACTWDGIGHEICVKMLVPARLVGTAPGGGVLHHRLLLEEGLRLHPLHVLVGELALRVEVVDRLLLLHSGTARRTGAPRARRRPSVARRLAVGGRPRGGPGGVRDVCSYM
eukprot:gene9817-biopygen8480